MNNLPILLLSLIFLVTGCSPKHPEAVDLSLETNDGNEVVVNARLAVSAAEKRNGLGKEDSIELDEGMLFIYGSDRHATFTMRGARNDISVAYLDSSGVIQEIYQMIIDPNTVYRSSEKCRYALQMAYSWFSDNGVGVGNRLILTPEVKNIRPIL